MKNITATIKTARTKMATYIAFSTTNFQMSGMSVYAVADTKAAAEVEAEERIVKENGPLAQTCGTNIYTDTLMKNLRVVSKSKAQRLGWLPRGHYIVFDEQGYRIER